MVNRTSSGQEYRSSVTGKLRFVFLSFLTLLVVALAACGGSSSTITGTPTARPSTGEWPQANYDYSNTRNTSGSSITEQNVNQLGVAWNVPVSGVSAFGALATSPVVANGVVYWQDLQSNVYAVDLKTGKLKWMKMYNAVSIGPNGVALDNNKLFVDSSISSVAALDAATGNQIWTWQDPQPKLQGIDQQATVYNGTVYISTVPGTGITSFYQGGQVGVLYALDEQTGTVKWSFNTVKDGNLWGNPQVNSGGGAWYPPAIDPSTGTTYWGIGNPGPFPGTKRYPNGSSRPGDTPTRIRNWLSPAQASCSGTNRSKHTISLTRTSRPRPFLQRQRSSAQENSATRSPLTRRPGTFCGKPLLASIRTMTFSRFPPGSPLRSIQETLVEWRHRWRWPAT